MRVLLVVAMLVLGVLVVQVLDRQVVPAVTVAQRARQIQQQLAEGKAALENWKLDEAEAAFRSVQALDPDNTEAADGLAMVAARRKLKALCDEADKLFGDGELSRARERYTRSGNPGARLLCLSHPHHRDQRSAQAR